jgi:hypothetical protein
MSEHWPVNLHLRPTETLITNFGICSKWFFIISVLDGYTRNSCREGELLFEFFRVVLFDSFFFSQ